jgi:hypothetical protein
MGILTFQAAAGGALNLNGPNIAGTVNLTLPSADGTSGQPLQTNGSGTLSFANLAIANGGTGTTSFTANQIHYGSFSQSAGLTFDGTNLATTGSLNSANTFGFKNRIINGGMVIDQRNAGAAVIATGTNNFPVDRFGLGYTQNSKFTAQQTPSATETGYATRVAAGFTNYLAATSSSAYSVLTGDTFLLNQTIEGLNCSDLAWGTANAKTITLSFLAYSSLTGTFGGSLLNSAANRSYPFSYSIPTANTWTQISITIAGDTSGTWLTTNGIGINVRFGLGSGSTFSGTSGAWTAGNIVQPTSTVSVVGTNGATFYITGVQLEKGSTATSFDFRSYGTELALCQRYLPAFNGNGLYFSGQAVTTTGTYAQINFPVTTRVAPTGITTSTISGTNFINYSSAGTGINVTALTYIFATPYNALITTTVASGLVAGNSSGLATSITSAQILFTGCEL